MTRLRRLVHTCALLTAVGLGFGAAPAMTAPPSRQAAAPAAAGARGAAATLPPPDHVVIVVLENKRYDKVIGDPKTPYLTELSGRGATFTEFYAETHPSQPNYLALFSGSTQGVTDNKCPYDFTGRVNLGRQLMDAGHTFVGYSEDLPDVGFRGCHSGGYVRRHNPWVNFDNVPATSNQPYSAFPSDFTRLPTLAFVVPNLCNDMHDCPKAQSDSWLRDRFESYLSWANTHNSLLVLTFDEDNQTGGNRIATLILGQHVRPGQYAERLDHYALLRTIQDMYGLAPTGVAAERAPITSAWAGA